MKMKFLAFVLMSIFIETADSENLAYRSNRKEVIVGVVSSPSN